MCWPNAAKHIVSCKQSLVFVFETPYMNVIPANFWQSSTMGCLTETQVKSFLSLPFAKNVSHVEFN